ncbi:MAG: CBS domain-containing protein [Gammaproteobacteria bacterium]|jgi:Mg/Co/Ni transporter MgtE
MKNEAEKLTLSFLEKHPVNAAQVLDTLDVNDIVLFIGSVPARLIAPVLEYMTPKTVSLCFVQLNAEHQGLILQNQSLHASLNILRHIAPEKRAPIYDIIPTRLAVRIKLQLKYSEGTVGSVMNTNVLMVNASQTAGKTLDTIRYHQDSSDSIIFVTDSSQRLKGFVEVTKLLRAEDKATVQQIMTPVSYSLQARASVNSVMNHTGWNHHDLLPVVDRENKIVGSLGYIELLNIPETSDSAKAITFNYLIVDILQIYTRAWLSVFNLFFDRRA